MRKLLAALFLIVLAFGVQARPGPDSNYNVAVSGGGGASPTWTGTGAVVNASCGFITTCPVSTTAAVTTGLVVAVVGVNNQSGSSGTITGVSVCGTSLTVDVANTIASGAAGAAIAHGSVTGGTCTISVTFSVAGSIFLGAASWGTLSNLASSTPGTSCNLAANQLSPYNCTGGLTVGAGGFGIVGYFDSLGTTPTASGANLTVDATATNANGSIAIGHATATSTAAQLAYAAGNNANLTTVLGEPFQ